MPKPFAYVLTLWSEKAFVGAVVSYMNVCDWTVESFVASSVDLACTV